jgi:N-methylhydantoinase A/oxoprolinase/acetone carboxylase beta subunit
MEAVRESGLRLKEIGYISDETTLVTNTIVEKKGAKVGLIATRGNLCAV